MPTINAGLYRIDLHQEYLGEKVLNSFWYREVGGDNDQAGLLNLNWDGLVIPPLSVVQNGAVVYEFLVCTPIFGTGIENVRPTAVAGGTRGGSQMPTFMAASLRLNRSTNELRNGWKRLVGLVEEETGAQSFAGTFIADLNGLAAVLDNTIVIGALQFEPVIVRKPFSTKAQDPNWVYTPVDSVTVLNRPTTQNTRKTF